MSNREALGGRMTKSQSHRRAVLPVAIVKILVAALMRPWTSRAAKAILDRFGLQYVNVSVPQRIGHLALETDCFLRDRLLTTGRLPVTIMIEPPHGGFANPVLAEYLARYVAILPRDAGSERMDRILVKGGYAVYTAPYAVAMYETALAYDVYRRWGPRAPLFTLTDADRAATRAFLREVGVPDGAWFVCVHARTGGYSPSDEHWHAHRNVDIVDYAEAMDRIVARGGWCIRMGDATMEPLPPQERVVDYARSSHKSARLDVALTASCRFFLGCASGLYNVASMFGRPSALANTTPLSGAYALGLDDLALPQGVRDASGRLLPVDAILATNVANFRLAEEFKGAGLTPRNVTPAEIAAITEEMLDRLDGVAVYTADDETRQERFRSLLRPGHYAHGTGSRLGREYLRAHLPLDAAPVCYDGGNLLDAALVGVDAATSPESVMNENAPTDAVREYGPEYYASHCGPVAYDRSRPEWAGFFGTIADDLIRAFRPHRVFDAGCAHGFLVEALWDRGVEAHGRDISTYAIEQVRPDMRAYCSAGSLVEPIEGRYDLLTCIEVLEHLNEEEGLRAIANLTRAASTIVMSSSPSDFTEPTHLNVQPPLYWIKAFAAHGFSPIIELFLPTITPHALAFQRTDEPPSPAFMSACAEIVRCRIQLQEDRQRLSVERDASEQRQIATFDAEYYGRANSDVLQAGLDPLAHYVTYGRREGRSPNAAMTAAIDGIVGAYEAGRGA